MKVQAKVKSGFTHYEQIILNSIDLEGYDTKDHEDIKDVLSEVIGIFESEYLHSNNRRIPYVKNLASWLQGLPTVLTVPFYNFEILENAVEYGYTFENEFDEDSFVSTYFESCANALITLDENY